MTANISKSATTLLRVLVFSSLFVGPVGAFAYSAAGTGGEGLGGAGFVLFVTLQRNAG